MALIINFTTGNTQSAKEFNFFDTTGTDAPGGYSAGSNPPVNTIQDAFVLIAPYLSTDTNFGLNVKRLSPLFPNTVNSPYVILNTDIGLSEDAPIPSGIYALQYLIIYPNLDEYVINKYVYLDFLHQCCADKTLANSRNCGCDDQTEKQALAISIQAKIDSIHEMLKPNCLDLEGANCIVKELDIICGCRQGGGCNGC